MTRHGNPWVVSFLSLDKKRTRRLMIWATDVRDAWNQAEWRLGGLDYVLSVKAVEEMS